METQYRAEPKPIELPVGLMESNPSVARATAGDTLYLVVSSSYEVEMQAAIGQSEAIAIQRLLTLVRRKVHLEVQWDEEFSKRVLNGPTIYPLLAVLLLLSQCTHRTASGKAFPQPNFERCRRDVLQHRLVRDLFSDSDVLICSDASGHPLPVDLYMPGRSRLRPREDYETLILDALAAQVGSSVAKDDIYRNGAALGRIVAELFENTDVHGKFDLLGRPLPRDSFRGLIFKRVKIQVPVARPAPNSSRERIVECFEASVFDSGVGYFSAYTKNSSTEVAPLEDEWKVLHNCLERHYHPELSDHRAGHRAMGLYEVLKAIQALKGRIEIRTGRLYAYRTFLDGELQAQMRPKASMAHIAWPVPRLLDVDKRYSARPTEMEPVIGASVRILVPLA